MCKPSGTHGPDPPTEQAGHHVPGPFGLRIKKGSMVTYKECSAAELAAMLDDLILGSVPTGALSMLDEAALSWTSVHPQLKSAHREFSSARSVWWPTTSARGTSDAWAQVVRTARELANGLRQYGDETLPLCGRPSVYGSVCSGVVTADGTCSYGEDSHITPKEN